MSHEEEGGLPPPPRWVYSMRSSCSLPDFSSFGCDARPLRSCQGLGVELGIFKLAEFLHRYTADLRRFAPRAEGSRSRFRLGFDKEFLPASSPPRVLIHLHLRWICFFNDKCSLLERVNLLPSYSSVSFVLSITARNFLNRIREGDGPNPRTLIVFTYQDKNVVPQLQSHSNYRGFRNLDWFPLAQLAPSSLENQSRFAISKLLMTINVSMRAPSIALSKWSRRYSPVASIFVPSRHVVSSIAFALSHLFFFLIFQSVS